DVRLGRGTRSKTHAGRDIPGDRRQSAARPGARRLAAQELHTRMVFVAPVAGALRLFPMARAIVLAGTLRVLSTGFSTHDRRACRSWWSWLFDSLPVSQGSRAGSAHFGGANWASRWVSP